MKNGDRPDVNHLYKARMGRILCVYYNNNIPRETPRIAASSQYNNIRYRCDSRRAHARVCVIHDDNDYSNNRVDAEKPRAYDAIKK